MFKLLMLILFISFVCLNLHYGLVKLVTLTAEEVAGNPGPWVYDIKE